MTKLEAADILDPVTTRKAVVEKARTIAAKALRESSWISVEDRIPEKFKPVIVRREGEKGKSIVEQGYKDIGDWWKVYGTRTKHVTHWMPLPEPPENELHETKSE